MIYFPTTVLNDFFDDPHDIIEISKSSKIKWISAGDGSWPGVRSQPLADINMDLNMFIMKKYFYTFFNYEEMQRVSFQSECTFQRIDPKLKSGWIHSDFPNIHTFVIYLTPNANPCSGTCTYTPKSYLKRLSTKKENSPRKLSFDEMKKLHYSGKISVEEMESARVEHNSQFEKDVMIYNRFNKLVGFDSHQYHGVEEFNTDTKERLTIVTFIHSLSCPPTPYQRMKAIDEVLRVYI